MATNGRARLTSDPKNNFIDDMTTTAALTLTVGILIFVFGTVKLIDVAAEDMNTRTSVDGGAFPWAVRLLANICQMLFGLVSVIIGFQYVVYKWGCADNSLFGLKVALVAWFPFVVQIAHVGFDADKEYITFPPLRIPYEVTRPEIGAAAFMAVLGFCGYAGTVFGALAFLHWKMYHCFNGFAHRYNASYYRSRLTYYGGLITMTGAVQFALGVYVQKKFGDGQLESPVVAGPFFIMRPGLSITVGLCQLVVGLLTIYRSTTLTVGAATHKIFCFHVISWLVFLLSLGCQVIGQLANVAFSPSIFLVNVIGFCLFPIYLDAMAHTTPENVTNEMFQYDPRLRLQNSGQSSSSSSYRQRTSPMGGLPAMGCTSSAMSC